MPEASVPADFFLSTSPPLAGIERYWKREHVRPPKRDRSGHIWLVPRSRRMALRCEHPKLVRCSRAPGTDAVATKLRRGDPERAVDVGIENQALLAWLYSRRVPKPGRSRSRQPPLAVDPGAHLRLIRAKNLATNNSRPQCLPHPLECQRNTRKSTSPILPRPRGLRCPGNKLKTF